MPDEVSVPRPGVWERDASMRQSCRVGLDDNLAASYDVDNPVHVAQEMNIESGSTLKMVFQDKIWGSTITFDANTPIALSGSLELGLETGVDPANLLDTRYQLFDWSGVSPTGQFEVINDLSGGYYWDTSQLYNTGSVILVPEPSMIILLTLGVGMMLLMRRR